MREIILPETEPALEWVNGRALQKVSLKRQHAVAQAGFAAALITRARANKSGVVGTEWRFQIEPPGEERRPLVPDVAFLSYQRMPQAEQMTTEVLKWLPRSSLRSCHPTTAAQTWPKRFGCIYVMANVLRTMRCRALTFP
jgi:hypothetical protein